MAFGGLGALRPAEVRVRASGSTHAGVAVLDTTPVAVAGRLETSIGLGEDLDVGLGGQVLHVAGAGEASYSREVLSGRLALRWAPASWIGASVGLGAGTSAGGTFVAPDLGVTLGYDGPVFGFFVDLRAGFSAPADPITLELTQPGDEQRHFAAPTFTTTVQITPGIQLRLLAQSEEPGRGEDVGVVLKVAPSWALLIDDRLTRFWFGGGLALEFSVR